MGATVRGRLIAVLSAIIALFLSCTQAELRRASSHRPRFALSNLVIYDHETPLAEIAVGADGFQSIRLRPGGKPLFRSWSIGWRPLESRPPVFRFQGIELLQTGDNSLGIRIKGAYPQLSRQEQTTV
ncbi:hypothetical protein ACFLT7_04675, partial [candidate division KSB1 bacterium]